MLGHARRAKLMLNRIDQTMMDSPLADCRLIGTIDLTEATMYHDAPTSTRRRSRVNRNVTPIAGSWAACKSCSPTRIPSALHLGPFRLAACR